MQLTNSRLLLSISFLLALTLFSAISAIAQQDQTPKRGFQAGGSYALSDIETINTGSGNLILSIPLASLPAGRGTAPGSSLRLLYNSKMFDSRVARYSQGLPEGGGGGCISPSGLPVPCDEVRFKSWKEPRFVNADWRAIGAALTPQGTTYNYTMNMLQGSQEGGWRYGLDYQLQFFKREDEYVSPSMPNCPSDEATYIFKLKMAFPDGAVREFHPTGYLQSSTLNDGYYRINYDGWYNSCGSGYYAVTGGMTYYSTDGSHLRLVIAHDGDTNPYNNGWTLYMPDGSRATGGNAPQRIYDRNNNYIEIQTVTLGNGHSARKVVDQVGRYFLIEYAAANEDHVVTWGANGEEIRWRITWKNIWVHKSYIATVDHPLPQGETNTREVKEQFTVVDQIILPAQSGSLTYAFNYHGSPTEPVWGSYTNGWGEMTSATLPSGAQSAYQYTHEQGTAFYADILRNGPTRKDLTYQKEYDNDTSVATETWLYALAANGGTITNPDGGILQELSAPSGHVYKSVGPDGTKIERIWAGNYPYASYADNLYVKTEFTSIKNAAGNWDQTAIKDFNYDKNGNVTAVREYDWVSYATVPRNGSDQPTGIPGGAALKRVTTNTYYNPTPDASDGSTDDPDVYHKSTSPQIKNAIASSEVTNGSQVLSRSESFYDNPSTTGNLTQQKSWDSTKGSYSNPLGANSISVATQYNQYGGPILTTDARGYQTQFVYGSVAGVSDLYPTQIKTAYQTAVQRTETREYDFNTSLPTRVTDADNNVSTATTYDAFGRPTLVRAAENKPEETRTATEYSDVNRRVIVRADLNTVGDGKLVTIQHYDRLGRVRLTRQLEDSATQSATDESMGIKTQTRYMFSGANSYQLVSNPFRAANVGAAGSEATMGWIRSKTDNGSRLVETQTFSGNTLPSPWGANSNSTGAVTTTYDAHFTTVTDQAGKVRRSMTDGLGQLARVDEPDDNNNLGTVTSPNQATGFSYDALGNLTTVSQGVQTRTFVYSSLKRLASAINPESGLISYQYDNNGNLLTKTDARNITTTFAYDALNRATSRTYSDSTATVTYTYDAGGVTNSKGRLTSISSSVSATNYTAYDALGRTTAGNQVTDGQTYSMSYSYNRANQTSMTYPSGRVITTEYDPAGRMAGVKDQQSGVFYAGALGTDATNRMQYAAHGAVAVMKLGNGLWEHRDYNSRLQPAFIGLGTSSTDSSTLGLTYNYGTSNNNGNLQTVTYAGGGLSYTQTFGYDQLNRLTTSVESGSSWSQTNKYDRYGNRAIDLGGGNQSLYFNTANNRITNSSYSYDAGNLINDGVHSYGFDGENKIKSVDGVSDVYRYDGDGNRVRKNFATGEKVRMVYSGGQLIAEYDLTSGALTKEYVYGGKGLIATIELANGTRYTTADHLGTPRVITNSITGVVSRHDYMPFGEEIGSGIGGRTTGMGFSVANGLRQKFTSKERDNETGLDYFLARYYASSQGRFSSPDEFGGGPSELFLLGKGSSEKQALPYAEITNPQSLNKYQYTYNNPLRFIDPDGHRIALGNSPKETKKDAERRMLGDMAKNERKYFKVVYDKAKGEYVLATRGNVDRALSRPHTQAFASMVAIIRHPDTIRVTIADQFVSKDGAGGVRRGSTESGGVTLSKNISLSGDIEVYLSEKGAKEPARGMDGKPIPTPKSIVASHEILGHGLDLLVSGTSSETSAIATENVIREGRGLPRRSLDDQ